MSGSNKFLVFHDFEQRSNGIYDLSPRHVTLPPPFRVGDEYEMFAEMMDEVAATTEPFDIAQGETDFFGPNNDVQPVPS